MRFISKCLFCLEAGRSFRVVVLAASLAMIAAPALAQLKYGRGAGRISEADIAGVPVKQLTRAYIPDAIDLSDRIPSPGDQGEVGSCVAWAVGYAARSYYRASEDPVSDPNNPDNIASPAYIYSRTWRIGERSRGSCEKSGSNVVHALRLLRDHGSGSLSSYPADRICALPSDASAPEAPQFRISGYELVAFKRGVAAGGAPQPHPHVVLDKLRLAIAQGHPVIVGMTTDNSLDALRPDEVLHSRAEAKLSAAPSGDRLGGSEEFVGHAMVFVGYDDRRRAFRVLNSWGPGWADGGYGWIGYDAVRHDMTDAFQMVPLKTPPKPAPMRPRSSVSDVARLKKELGLSLSDPQCSDLLFFKKPGGGYVLEGFVSNEADREAATEAASRRLAAANIEVNPWPICDAKLTLREPRSAPNPPEITVVGAANDRLKIGDKFSIRVTTPDYPSFNYVFYLQADGKVVGLAPRRGPLREQTRPGAELTFGDGVAGRRSFKASGPIGAEAVIAISARSPIPQLEALDDGSGRIYSVQVSQKPEEGDGPDDRMFLSLMRRAMLDRPDPTALPREIAAAVHPVFVDER